MEGTTPDIRSRTWRGIPVDSLPNAPGVYLLHFTKGHPHGRGKGGKARRVRHYGGWSPRLRKRIQGHRDGSSYGAYTRAMLAAGIRFRVARVWTGMGPAFEHMLKAKKGFAKLCPICNKGLRTGDTGGIVLDVVTQARDIAIFESRRQRELEREGIYAEVAEQKRVGSYPLNFDPDGEMPY